MHKDLRYAVLGALETKEDRELFENLLSRRYREAFQIPPDQVSLGGQAFLSMFAFHLLEKENLKELESFTNGLLYVDKNHSLYTGTAHMETYISYLYRMNTVIMEAEAESFYASSLFTDEIKQELLERNQTFMELTTYWGGLDALCSNDLYADVMGEIRNMELMYGYKISNLKHGGKGLSFDCTYLTARIGDLTLMVEGKNILEIFSPQKQVLHVDGFRENSSIGIDNVQVLDRIEKLMEEKERLKANYVVNGLIGVSAAIHPVLGILGNLAMGITEGNATKTSINSFSLAEKSGLFNNQALNSIKGSARGSAAILTNWLDYKKAAANIDEKIEKEKWEKSVRMFGCVGGVSTSIEGETNHSELVYSGLADPGRMAALGRWSEEGLAGLGDERLDGEMVKKIKSNLKSIKFNNLTIPNDLITILDGGNNIKDIEIDVLIENIKTIEKVYGDLTSNSSDEALIDIGRIFEESGRKY